VVQFYSNWGIFKINDIRKISSKCEFKSPAKAKIEGYTYEC
jgi:hypothetical protein